MNTETLETLVRIFTDVGATTKHLVMIVLIYYGGRYLIGIGVLLFFIVRATRLLSDLISGTLLAKRMQQDLGYGGLLVSSERRKILEVWERGRADRSCAE